MSIVTGPAPNTQNICLEFSRRFYGRRAFWCLVLFLVFGEGRWGREQDEVGGNEVTVNFYVLHVQLEERLRKDKHIFKSLSTLWNP